MLLDRCVARLASDNVVVVFLVLFPAALSEFLTCFLNNRVRGSLGGKGYDLTGVKLKSIPTDARNEKREGRIWR